MTKRMTRIATAAAAAFLLSCATRAAADSPGAPFWLYDRDATHTFQHGQIFAGFTMKGGVQQLPRFNSNVSFRQLVLGVFSFAGKPDPLSRDVAGVEPGGEIGYAFRDGALPQWMGSRVRVALFGSYFHAEKTQSHTSGPLPTTTFGTLYQSVTGNLLAGFTIILPGTTLGETLKVERDGFQLGLKLDSDFALSPEISFTPSIAVFGGRTSDSYYYTTILHNYLPGVEAGPTSLSERLRTTEFGAHLGGRLTWQFRPGWALHFGGTAGPVWLRSRLSATDCLSSSFVPLGSECGPSAGGTFLSNSASDSRSALGFRGTASLGLAADLRYALIALGGYMRYDTHVPGIQNPQLSSLTSIASAVTGPVRIRYAGGVAYGGFVTIRVPLH